MIKRKFPLTSTPLWRCSTSILKFPWPFDGKWININTFLLFWAQIKGFGEKLPFFAILRADVFKCENPGGGFWGVACSVKLFCSMSSTTLVRIVFRNSAPFQKRRIAENGNSTFYTIFTPNPLIWAQNNKNVFLFIHFPSNG